MQSGVLYDTVEFAEVTYDKTLQEDIWEFALYPSDPGTPILLKLTDSAVQELTELIKRHG